MVTCVFRLLSVLIAVIFTGIAPCSGAKILAINFISSKSHFIVYSPLLYALAERGHEVTIFTPDPPSGKAIPNVRHIQIYDTIKVASKTLDLFQFNEESSSSKFWKYFNCNFWSFRSFVEDGCRRGFEHEFTKELLLQREKFDLVILTPLYNECLYGLIHKLNVSTVLFNQVSVLPWQAESFGSPNLPSFNPLLYYGFSDSMTFWERAINFVGTLYFELVLELYYNPAMERLYCEYVDVNLPPLKQIERNSSLILTNSHVSLVPPKPLMPDVIEVGGLHLRPPNPLPQDLGEFCKAAEPEGFILFSMGSFLQGSTMPEKYRQIFVKTFAKLKQRVLWKWETETMKDLPSNVKLVKWLPQQDVLAHKNIRMFITHGGHGGVTEAIYEGVPLVGIPMFSDQFWNMEQAVRKGFALSLTLTELTEDGLLGAINRILSDQSFQRNAKLLSQVYKDHVNSPLERAVYWVEYVLRYRGAPHLRSAGRNLNVFQYYSLDVLGFLLVVLVILLTVSLIASKILVRMLCRSCRPICSETKLKTH